MNLSTRAFWFTTVTLLLATSGQWAPVDTELMGIHVSAWWRLPAAILILLVCIEALSARLIRVPAVWLPGGTLQLARSSDVSLQVRNPYPRALTVDVFLRDTAAIRFPAARHRLKLPAGDSSSILVTVMPARLGACSLPRTPLRVLGRFGLVWWTRYGSPSDCTVVPDALHGNERNVAIRPNGLRAQRQRGQGLELLSMRDYQPGDSIRRIHWKASARAQRLTVRDMADEQRLELVLVIDTGRGSGLHMGSSDQSGEASMQRVLRLHHNVNIAARLGELALSSGDRITLITYAGQIQNEQLNLLQSSGTRRLRASLAALSPSTLESNPLAAAMAIRRLRQPRSLVVWLTDFDSGDQYSLIRAARMLLPRHLPMLVTACDPALDQLAAQPAVNWADPHISLAAQQARDNLHETEIKLTRLGAEVVVSAPCYLDAAVLERYEMLKIRRRV